MLLLVVPFDCLSAKISDGSVDYSLSMQALSVMTTELIVLMGYVVGLLYVIASLLAIYNAMVIYIKMTQGEEGVTKSIMMLLGAVLFLIGATIVMPGLFGYDAMGGGHSWFG